MNNTLNMNFTPGNPACPIACKYCFITEHDARRDVWNKKRLVGVNKACTFVNVSPWINEDINEQQQFADLNYDLLYGDIIGFTAITDPFWPKIEKYLLQWAEKSEEKGKLITLVTKWPLNKRQINLMARFKSLKIVYGVGTESLEKVHVNKKIKALELLKDLSIPTLPICHPYIEGFSNLEVFKEIYKIGYTIADVKGFRADFERMTFLQEKQRKIYTGISEELIGGEQRFQKILEEYGLTMISPRKWYHQEIAYPERKVEKQKAIDDFQELSTMGNLLSSDPENLQSSYLERRIL